MKTDTLQKLIKCGVCGRPAPFVFKEKVEIYTLWECPLCFIQFWEPMKNPGQEWYEADPCLSFRNVVKRISLDKNHKEFLKENIQPARLLDVGMGTGNFMLAAQKRGYDVWGIDFNKESVKVARNNFGLKNSYPETLETFIGRYKGPPFEVVTCFEVIEHLDNPGEFLESAKTILTPNGYLALSVPNRDSHRLFKDMDHPPKHLTRWDERSMRNFLENYGFQIIRLKKLRPDFSYLVMKFHRWTQGFLSFGLVNKLASVSAVPVGPEVEKKLMAKIDLLRRLAQIKDWLIFTLPAAILYFYLFLRRQHYAGLYVLARKRV